MLLPAAVKLRRASSFRIGVRRLLAPCGASVTRSFSSASRKVESKPIEQPVGKVVDRWCRGCSSSASFVPGMPCLVDVVRNGDYQAGEVTQVLEAGRLCVRMREGRMAGMTIETSADFMKKVGVDDEDDSDDDNWLVKAMAAQQPAGPQHTDSDPDRSLQATAQAINTGSVSDKPTLSSLGGYQGAQAQGSQLPLKPLDTSFFGKLRREGRLSMIGDAKRRGATRLQDVYEYKAKKQAFATASKGAKSRPNGSKES